MGLFKMFFVREPLRLLNVGCSESQIPGLHLFMEELIVFVFDEIDDLAGGAQYLFPIMCCLLFYVRNKIQNNGKFLAVKSESSVKNSI